MFDSKSVKHKMPALLRALKVGCTKCTHKLNSLQGIAVLQKNTFISLSINVSSVALFAQFSWILVLVFKSGPIKEIAFERVMIF